MMPVATEHEDPISWELREELHQAFDVIGVVAGTDLSPVLNIIRRILNDETAAAPHKKDGG